ncbi:MAG: hypothetical protein H5T45_07140 [Thermoplasmatales archaeon]|nr:hypothetical protein [Thermoplasmatales archaeon]
MWATRPQWSLYDEVYRIINEWKPEHRYRGRGCEVHHKYKDDLRSFIEEALEKRGLKKITVSKEKDNIDILVGKEVVVEIKHSKNGKITENVKKELIQRVVEWQEKKYEGVIIVLVGKIEKNEEKDIINRVNNIMKKIQPQPSPYLPMPSQTPSFRVDVINKSWAQ